MKSIILCAGYATRLYPLTKDKPKALLPIKYKPVLNYIIEKIEEVEEIDKIFIVSNARFYKNFVSWFDKNRKKFKKGIRILNDGTCSNETRLGGIGDLWFAIEKEKIDDDILVVLGDNVFSFSLEEMVEYFKTIRKTLIGVYDLYSLEKIRRLGVGVVELKDRKVVSFEEKPQDPKSTLSSIGIYIFIRADLKKIEEYMKTDKSKDAPGHLVKYMVERGDVYAFVFKGESNHFDIGTKEVYESIKNSLPI